MIYREMAASVERTRSDLNGIIEHCAMPAEDRLMLDAALGALMRLQGRLEQDAETEEKSCE